MIVRESINFERGKDPKKSMRIGKSKLIEDWMEKYFRNVSKATLKSIYTINSDFTIDISGFFAMDWEGNFPDFIQFRNAMGGFYIGNNPSMTSLRGCPEFVYNDFDCCRNNLKNLIGGPKTVSGNYFCGLNPLESFEGIAPFIRGSFACNNKTGLTERDLPNGVRIKGSISIGEW